MTVPASTFKLIRLRAAAGVLLVAAPLWPQTPSRPAPPPADARGTSQPSWDLHLESGLEIRPGGGDSDNPGPRQAPSGLWLTVSYGLDPRLTLGFRQSGDEGAQQPVLLVLPLVADTNPSSPHLWKRWGVLDLMTRFSEATPGQPGGELEGYGPNSSSAAVSLNSFGQRSQSNNFHDDGLDNTEPWLRGAAIPPSPEAVETVTLRSGYLPATLGPGAGAGLATQSRSGAARWHGNLFEYLENSIANARNFFDGGMRPSLGAHRFGVSAGGPLRRGWAVFTGAELSRERRGLTVVSTVPTVSQKLGEFGSVPIFDPLTLQQTDVVTFFRQPFPGNRIPPSQISIPARMLAALYPDANLPGAFYNFRSNPKLGRDSERLDVRADYSGFVGSHLTVRLSGVRTEVDSPSAFPGSVASDPAQHANAASTRIHAWSSGVAAFFKSGSSLLHAVRAGVTSTSTGSSALDAGADAAMVLGIPGLNPLGLPLIQPTGYASLGAARPAPFQLRTRTYQAAYTARWLQSRRLWTFGGEILRRHADGDASEWTPRGTFLFTPDYTSQPGVPNTGDAFASLLTGYPSEVRRDIQFDPYRLRGWEAAAFVQTEIQWKRFRLEAGVRYSYLPPVREAANRMVNLNHNREQLALDWFAGRNQTNTYAGAGYNSRAISPRVGFTVALRRDGSTLLRGAFSQSYDSGPYLVLGILARNAPFAARQDLYNGSLQLGPHLTQGVPAPEPTALLNVESMNRAAQAVYAIEPSTWTPYSNQWELRLERRLGRDLTIEAGGMGSMGMHLPSMLNANQPYPAPTPYPWRRHPYDPYLYRIENLGLGGGSTYYGGQIRIVGAVLPRLRLLASYRYGKAIDDAPAPLYSQQGRSPGAQYIYHPRSMRAPSSFDITQRITLNAAFELPSPPQGRTRRAFGGWILALSLLAQSGFPFTPELAVNGLNNGGFWLPDRLGKGDLPASQRSSSLWFDARLEPSGAGRSFRMPPLYQYGNSGYNIVRGPGLVTVDTAFQRGFRVREGLRAGFRLEAYNLFNRVNLGFPNRILGLPSSGAIRYTASPSRQFLLALRLGW